MTSPPRLLDVASSKVALVFNGAAGKKDARLRTDAIRERLAPNVADFATYPVMKGVGIADAAKRAMQDGAQIILALGGDGTQAAVASAVVGSETVMATLPGGTFNYFARELGVGDTVDMALDAVLAGHVRQLDVGDVNGRIFLNNASFGVYPEILQRREAIYRRWGRSRIAAYWSVIIALRDMRDPMHLSLIQGNKKRDIRTPLAFAARSAFQLESLGLDGAPEIRDGKIALFIATGRKPRDLLAAAFRLAAGRVMKGQDFELLVADEFKIEIGHKHRLLAFDGEKGRMSGPFHMRVQRKALSVIVPAPVIGQDPRGDRTGVE